MSTTLVTVEEAARQLRLHAKTVLRHIREGRLRATRIGKSYRIAQSDLDAFVGGARDAAVPRADRATCTIDVPGISAEAAGRLANYLGAATMSGDAAAPPLHVSTAFDPTGHVLKVVVIGAPADVSRVLQLFHMLREQPR